LSIVAPPAVYTTHAATLTVRGIVFPAQARIIVQGRAVDAPSGLFTVKLGLSVGSTTILVAATAPGLAPVHATVQVRRLPAPVRSSYPYTAAGPPGAIAGAAPASPRHGARRSAKAKQTPTSAEATPEAAAPLTATTPQTAPPVAPRGGEATGSATVPHLESAQPEVVEAGGGEGAATVPKAGGSK
jgi:hypothetical protein